MPNFANLSFSPSVKALQSRYGSRAAYARMEGDDDEIEAVHLGPNEAQFIAARDSFYQATVSATGWPYVQHRGGPMGFLTLLDSQTLGFADFLGNRQYISTGNLLDNDRISLFLMDYPNKRRLKILGRVKIVLPEDDPALLAKLENPHYRARVERAFVIKVEAFDWNCPKHITPRLSQPQFEAEMQEMRTTIQRLQDEIARLNAQASGQAQD